MKNFKQIISYCLIVCMALAGFPLSAQASMIATDQISMVGAAASTRDKVNAFLAREDVRQAVLAQGVSPQAATDRVQAMTDGEVAQLAGRIEQAPAGGDVLGLFFTVFIVLLFADILEKQKRHATYLNYLDQHRLYPRAMLIAIKCNDSCSKRLAVCKFLF